MAILGLPYLSPLDIKLLTLANHFFDSWGNFELLHMLHLCFGFALCALGTELQSKKLILLLGAGKGQRPTPIGAGVHHTGHVQVRWPRVTLSKAQGLTIWYDFRVSWCSGSSSLLLCMQKGGSCARDKEQLAFSATEGFVDCPAMDKLNF